MPLRNAGSFLLISRGIPNKLRMSWTSVNGLLLGSQGQTFQRLDVNSEPKDGLCVLSGTTSAD